MHFRVGNLLDLTLYGRGESCVRLMMTVLTTTFAWKPFGKILIQAKLISNQEKDAIGILYVSEREHSIFLMNRLCNSSAAWTKLTKQTPFNQIMRHSLLLLDQVMRAGKKVAHQTQTVPLDSDAGNITKYLRSIILMSWERCVLTMWI